MPKHLLSVADLSDDDFQLIIERAQRFRHDSRGTRTLAGLSVGIYFRKTSTRTRTAFSVAAQRLGAQVVAYGPNDLQENTGESSADTGRILSLMLDGLVARTAGDPRELRAWAEQERMAVVNAMTSDEHPTQALSDLATMREVAGRLDGLRVLYVGEGNNTACALALALARVPGAELHLRTPPGYGVLPDKLAQAQSAARAHGAHVGELHHMQALPDGVDVVYTTRWQTTGTQKSDPGWRKVFAPFKVDGALIAGYPECWFMHDLPAHRGEEVEAEVLDGARSVVMTQAEYKLYGAMAILSWCLPG